MVGAQQISTFDTILAVTDEPDRSTANLLGTAFVLGQGALATAGHVVEAIENAKRPTLRKMGRNGIATPIPIKASEKWEFVDFGIVLADYVSTPIPWSLSGVVERTDVWTEGYGFGLDLNRRKLVNRHFKGHVVSRQIFQNRTEIEPTRMPPDDFRTPILETSFMAPKGQSGAPLLARLGGSGHIVVGIIIGNSETSLGAIAQRELLEDSGVVERYEIHNYMHLGQAISSECLLHIESEILGATGDSPSSRRSVKSHLQDYVVD